MRIIHLSDVHIWRYALNPARLFSKRALGMMSLVAGRASRFRLERLEEVVARIQSISFDHLLITGDLTTTALPSEFADALFSLEPLLRDAKRVTVVPGNHDRYTSGSKRKGHFEDSFGAFMPAPSFPWVRQLDNRTWILGLDPTRPSISARGLMPIAQLDRAISLLEEIQEKDSRIIIACHYPLSAPPSYLEELHHKRLINAASVMDWLKEIGPHLYCCGHVHAAWAFHPANVENQLSLNAGAPLLRDPTGLRPPGFLEIELHNEDVSVVHHAWYQDNWAERPIYQNPSFFPL